jgi:4-amino-4-deoxychorismate lyase
MLINGRPADSVPATDRGLQYGDGLFETVAVRRGAPCLWPRHLARLARGCERLGIPLPDRALVTREAQALLGGAAPADGTLKLIVTRGSGPRGYAPPAATRPTRIIFFTPDPSSSSRGGDSGVCLTLCRTRLGDNERLAGIKHLNRLEQVLARSEWSDPGILDGVMCDGQGRAVCGTMSNLYLIDDDGIATPPLTRSGVAGTVREVVQQAAAALGMPFRETHLRPADLLAAPGVMLSNALLGLVPVSRLEHRCYDIGMIPAALLERVRRTALEPETSS